MILSTHRIHSQTIRGTYIDDGTSQIAVDCHFRDVVGSRSNEVIASRLVAVRRPAVTPARSSVGRRAVADRSSRNIRKVEDVVSNGGIGSENGVRSRDDGHSER